MVDFLRNCLTTEDGKIVYLLMLIAFTMIADFITGTWSAKINKDIEFRSKEGINGILRKVGSMLLMIIFVPFSVIIPNGVGLGLVYVMYIGYELMELKSIMENLNNMGVDITPFKDYMNNIEKEDDSK